MPKNIPARPYQPPLPEPAAPKRPSAAELNRRLYEGGFVEVTTYTNSLRYGARHAGWFEERGGNLYVRRGRGFDCLSQGQRLLVSLRVGLGDPR